MKENLSQRKLLEVLTHEIEVLRKTSTNINEVAPIIDKRLQELKQTRLLAQVDVRELKAIIEEHQEFIKQSAIIPRWFLLAFAIVLGLLILQSLWIYFRILY